MEWNYQNNEKGVAVVIHGLNLDPEKMNPLIDFLKTMNISSLKVRLKGHRGSLDEFKNVSREIWFREVEKSFSEAFNYARKKNLPVVFLGYSLGALTGLDVLTNKNRFKFKGAILFAPAISVKKISRKVMVFKNLNNRFTVPSRSPRKYRANWGTPLPAYEALFSHNDELKKRYSKLNFPLICFIDKKDELIDYRELVNIVSDHKLDKWKLVDIEKDKSAKYSSRHLIIDQASLGKETWEKVLLEMEFFLKKII